MDGRQLIQTHLKGVKDDIGAVEWDCYVGCDIRIAWYTKDVFEANNRVLCGLVFAIFAFVLWITNVPS
jgi:hypothetical protein